MQRDPDDRYVREKRDTLLALRSEDERQRLVAEMIEEASQGIGPQTSR